jgi:hypothetical protein
LSEWRECSGGDVDLREDLIHRIENKRAFWMLPEADDVLYVFGDQDPLLMRDLGGGIIEWILSEDETTNQAGLEAWREVDVEEEAREFFSVVENPAWEEFEAAKESIGMAEAEPEEMQAAIEEEGADVMAVLLLVKRGLWPKRKAHPGYPSPMKVWTYQV